MSEYQLVVDETNLTESADAKFFITGGILFDADKRQKLHFEVENIRRKYGFAPSDLLKFNTHSQDRVSSDAHREAKNEVLRLCLQLPVYFIANVRLHAMVRKVEQRQRQLVTWGIDSILFGYRSFLGENSAHGTASFDTLPFKGGASYLQEKFSSGLIFRDGGRLSLRDRITKFETTCDGSSHEIAVADIVLGAYRYCVNKREAQNVAAATMMPYIWQMALWGRSEGDAFDYGLRFLPQIRTKACYEREYAALRLHLLRLIHDNKDVA